MMRLPCSEPAHGSGVPGMGRTGSAIVRRVNTKGHVQVGLGSYPWRWVAFSLGAMLLFAAIEGNLGWRAVGVAFAFAAWVALIFAVARARPSPEATSFDGHFIVQPPALARYGAPVVSFGPLIVLMLLAGPGSDSSQHPWYWGLLAFFVGGAFLLLAAGGRKIRMFEGGFEEIGFSGRAVRVEWTAVKAVRYDEQFRRLLLVAQFPGRNDRTVAFPHAWNGFAAFAAAALKAIPKDALRPAPEERSVLEQLAALSKAPPA